LSNFRDIERNKQSSEETSNRFIPNIPSSPKANAVKVLKEEAIPPRTVLKKQLAEFENCMLSFNIFVN